MHKHIILHTQYYLPEMGAPQARLRTGAWISATWLAGNGVDRDAQLPPGQVLHRLPRRAKTRDRGSCRGDSHLDLPISIGRPGTQAGKLFFVCGFFGFGGIVPCQASRFHPYRKPAAVPRHVRIWLSQIETGTLDLQCVRPVAQFCSEIGNAQARPGITFKPEA